MSPELSELQHQRTQAVAPAPSFRPRRSAPSGGIPQRPNDSSRPALTGRLQERAEAELLGLHHLPQSGELTCPYLTEVCSSGLHPPEVIGTVPSDAPLACLLFTIDERLHAAT